MKAVRYRNASGEFRIGRLEDESIVDAGPAGEQGFVPTRAAWAALARPTGRALPARRRDARCTPSCPRKLICIGLNYRDHAEESELDIPDGPGHLRQVDDLADRPRRDDRDPARGDAPRLRGRARGRDRRAGLPRHGRRGARGRGRLHLLPRRLRAPRAARDAAAASSRTARASTRSGRSAPASSTPTASTSARSQVTTVVSGRDDAGLEHEQPDLRDPGARRVRLARDDARAGRCDRHRHAGRGRRLPRPPPLPARGRRRRRHRERRRARSATR